MQSLFSGIDEEDSVPKFRSLASEYEPEPYYERMGDGNLPHDAFQPLDATHISSDLIEKLVAEARKCLRMHLLVRGPASTTAYRRTYTEVRIAKWGVV